jgi:hypothetical protein
MQTRITVCMVLQGTAGYEAPVSFGDKTFLVGGIE